MFVQPQGIDIGASSEPEEDDHEQEEEEELKPHREEVEETTTAGFPRHGNTDFVERCEAVPLRLSSDERLKLQTLTAALKVSEYTDEVDTMSRRHKGYRIVDALEDMVRLSTGIAVCGAPNKAKAIVGMSKSQQGHFFRDMFEVGRRHKIMNPDKMRSEYGKLMYMLQDAQSRAAKEALGFQCFGAVKTVTAFLAAKHSKDLLWDARLPVACGFLSGDKAAARLALHKTWTPALAEAELQLVIDSIDDARCYLDFNVAPVDAMLQHLEASFDPRQPTPARPVSLSLRRSDQRPPQWPISKGSDMDDDHQVDDLEEAEEDDAMEDVQPQSDDYSLTAAARRPRRTHQRSSDEDDDSDEFQGRKMHDDTSSADDSDDDDDDEDYEEEHPKLSRGRLPLQGMGSRLAYSLNSGLSRLTSSLQGQPPPKLTHDHATQYCYVRQSLLLWREVMRNMYKLWGDADTDLLVSTGGSYQLWNTGQGLNRVQACPRVAASMRRHLAKAQRESGHHWVGLSVVHLGDRDVPNALMFIDKYTQVPRILAPIVAVLDALPKLWKSNKALRTYIRTKWGGPKEVHLAILSDFFKRAFDGDGDDGGSCIDGRLTSCWNWCSKISKKDYYPLFSMAGFQSWDGNYRDE